MYLEGHLLGIKSTILVIIPCKLEDIICIPQSHVKIGVVVQVFNPHSPTVTVGKARRVPGHTHGLNRLAYPTRNSKEIVSNKDEGKD